MATKKPKLRAGVITKNKSYKFGKSLGKGEKVFIKEEVVGRGRCVYTAFRKKNDTVGFGVNPSEFEFTEKEKYVVLVTRIAYASRNIEVEATSRKEAEALAIDEAGGFEFSEHDADYKADAVFTREEHGDL